jgi:hypothetical protein
MDRLQTFRKLEIIQGESGTLSEGNDREESGLYELAEMITFLQYIYDYEECFGFHKQYKEKCETFCWDSIR